MNGVAARLWVLIVALAVGTGFLYVWGWEGVGLVALCTCFAIVCEGSLKEQ